MINNHKIKAIGLMSGTSGDGIDIAYIISDGNDFIKIIAKKTVPYSAEFAKKLNYYLSQDNKFYLDLFNKNTSSTDKVSSIKPLTREDLVKNLNIAKLDRELTLIHIKVVKKFIQEFNSSNQDDSFLANIKGNQNLQCLIGFHGQTIYHNPSMRTSVQLGNGQLMADTIQTPVVTTFRQQDMMHGGNGAPLAPVYHQALARSLEKPLIILNLGGVANITYIQDNVAPIACDTGPGMALINDWMFKKLQLPFDESGQCAALGKVDNNVLGIFKQDSFWQIPPPKSLDRNNFAYLQSMIGHLSAVDGAATLTACSSWAVKIACQYLPSYPKSCYLTGGGRLNLTLKKMLEADLNIPVIDVDNLQWDGDNLEAQMMAYLAIRSYLQLPLSFPTSTGVQKPVSGGVWHYPHKY